MTEPVAAFWTIEPETPIPNNFVVPYYLDDVKRRIAVARVDDRLYAFDDLCSCSVEPCPLSGGRLTGTTIMCQCHGSQFDVTTGSVIKGPASSALGIYEASELDQGRIRIRARPAPAFLDGSFKGNGISENRK
jgi:nitrite reductase/ring-hydroxylating ferredoxin subunit